MPDEEQPNLPNGVMKDPSEPGAPLDVSPHRLAFRESVGDIYIDPEYLDPVREVSDRALTCIVEEARWYHDDEDEDKYDRVIVKTYRPNMIGSAAELEELLAECKRINGLEHDNLIHLEGVGCFKAETKADVRASVFIVEEFGGLWSLFKMLRSKKLHPTHPHVQFTPADCMRWIINIAEALAYLHSHKVIHRDLKPENIWLTDADVSECMARIGDLKPHRRNFRKFAHGHVRSAPPMLVDQDVGDTGSNDSGHAMRQFSLARHQTMQPHRHLKPTLSRMGSSNQFVAPATSGLSTSGSSSPTGHGEPAEGIPWLEDKQPSSPAPGRRTLQQLPSFMR